MQRYFFFPCVLLLSGLTAVAHAEDILRELFDQTIAASAANEPEGATEAESPDAPGPKGRTAPRQAIKQGPPPLVHSWGDKPAAVEANAVVAGIGLNRSGAARLRAAYPDSVEHNLSYWSYNLAEPVPLAPQLESISFQAKTNLPLSIKIAISPFGFIYHGPGVGPSDDWQKVTLNNAYAELKQWCANGGRRAEDGWISAVIVAVADKPGIRADVTIDDIALEGPPGARKAVEAEAFARKIRRVHVAPISLTWDEGHRTLDATLLALDEAGSLGADLACLPQECVDQAAEPIPGPASQAIANKAAQHGMYIVGNLREKAGNKTYVTSFLCDRQGNIAGKYRKSHKLPYEDDFDLGDELPVFATDFGAVGLKIGTDHFFPEIDTVLRRRGASLVVWSTKPFPLRDEHYISYALRGRAVDNGLCYAVARYAGKQGYGGYASRFSWTASWPLGRAQVIGRDGHTIADTGHRGGVALAAILRSQLGGSPHGGGYPTTGPFAAITAAELPAPPETSGKRVIRAAAIEREPSIDRLIEKLDACGKQNCDIACLWEYVWYRSDEEVEKYKDRNRQRLDRIAEAARRNNMYVLIAGELERGFNESILYDRQGREMGRYTKIAQTTSPDSEYYRAGQKVGIFDVDFGRICTKICLDVSRHEIDRVAALHQVDLLLLSTQDAGPYSEHIRYRDNHRAIDNGYFLLRAAGGGSECDHRTYIIDPWGVVLAASQFGVDNPPIVSTIKLDNRPKYYEWPEQVRKAGTYPDPVKRGFAVEERMKMYGRYHRPLSKGDLRSIVLQCRRPELYRRAGAK